MFLFFVVFCQIIVWWRFGVVVKGLLRWLLGFGVRWEDMDSHTDHFERFAVSRRSGGGGKLVLVFFWFWELAWSGLR